MTQIAIALQNLGREIPSQFDVVSRMMMRLLDWQETYRQRRHLREIGDHLLDDIGISRADAERESRKPVWR